jgi:hypothetical protein
MRSLHLTTIGREGHDAIEASIGNLIIAGWTGRNADALEAHIAELEKLGIARPRSTPIFYRASPELLTNGPVIQVVGTHSSGEVEPVLMSLDGGLFLGVGSDHTDRKVEAIGVTISKQLCAKPVSATLWRFSEVADHWDDLIIRSYVTVTNKRRLYQEGALAAMRHPRDLMMRYLGTDGTLPAGTTMFCGTLAVHGEIAPAELYELEIEDPVLNRSIAHRYAVDTLPVEG